MATILVVALASIGAFLVINFDEVLTWMDSPQILTRVAGFLALISLVLLALVVFIHFFRGDDGDEFGYLWLLMSISALGSCACHGLEYLIERDVQKSLRRDGYRRPRGESGGGGGYDGHSSGSGWWFGGDDGGDSGGDGGGDGGGG